MLTELEDPESATIRLEIDGMHCASCVSRVERFLKRLPGVDEASVNLANKTATVSYDPLLESKDTLIEAISKSGYSASVPSQEDNALSNISRIDVKLYIAVVLATAIMLCSMFVGDKLFELSCAIAGTSAIVVFYCGQQFFIGAWNASVKGGGATMDTLVTVGSSAAYFLSAYELAFVRHPQLYFDSAATIITLILIGRHLEGNATRTASDSLKTLSSLIPSSASILTLSGEEIAVPTREVVPGDNIRVRPGERIAVDGIISAGDSSVDESLLTGESTLVPKGVGSKVIGGSINADGSFVFRATAVGSGTTVAKILRLVQDAQGSKAPIQGLADKISSVFVPIVFAISALTVLLRLIGFHESLAQAIIPAVSVLVIACPCALGLATPTAIMVGIGRAATLGILIRNGSVLQNAESIRTVLFDKTGTLTQGKPSVNDTIVTATFTKSEVLRLAASAESYSSHPVARSVVEAAEAEHCKLLPATDFLSITGLGVSATVEGRKILIGNLALLEREDIPVPSDILDQLTSLLSQEKTVLLVSIDSAVAAVIALSDTVRAEAAKVIATLRALGIESAMLTGDQAGPAAACARATGITEYRANLLPEDKSEVVRSWNRNAGARVAMVGDGVNDAPALAMADVGIAMGHATDIAVEASAVTLLSSDLNGICNAINLSRETMKVIRQNLWWAFLFNTIGIPLASFGILNPMIAAFAMAFSSVAVVSNSLRLRNTPLAR
jgi:P-type Cu+ transporter